MFYLSCVIIFPCLYVPLSNWLSRKRFEWYTAASALTITFSILSSPVNMDTPILKPVTAFVSGVSQSILVLWNSLMNIFAICWTFCSFQTSGRTIPNSSHPYRATKSVIRTLWARTCAIALRTPSPTRCPHWSLIFLKESTSMSIKAPFVECGCVAFLLCVIWRVWRRWSLRARLFQMLVSSSVKPSLWSSSTSVMEIIIPVYFHATSYFGDFRTI